MTIGREPRITPPPELGRGEHRWNIMAESSTRETPLKGTINAIADGLKPVDAVRPVAPYIGGKRNLANRLVKQINATPHSLYAEVMVGMGGVFLRRTHRPSSEVINDISADVATLFRILQRHHQSFMEELKWRLTSRSEFERLMATAPDTLTDLERAARFLYLQRTSFGGKVEGRNFGVVYAGRARFDLTKLGPILQDVHERLASVIIERLPWQTFIDRYDRAGTLFYLDPPYHGCETDYGTGIFDTEDFAAIADRLGRLRGGRFIMSINDHPDIRRLFGRFCIEEVPTTYTLSGGHLAQRVTELVISG
ncbi:MAG: DNA adenine methylase [Sphingomonadales bacterium]